jgi:hypothetical protein
MTFLHIIVLVVFAAHFSLAAPIATEKPKPATALSAADMNQLFGIFLWSGDRLWDEDARAVAERLNFRTEFASSNLASYVCRPAPKILGVQPETLRLSSRDSKPDSLLIMFANKGDSVSMKPDRDHFMKPADYNHALSTYQKDLASFPARVRTELALVKAQLTKALGEPEHLTFGEGSATAEVVKLWWWKEHAILLATSPGESLSVRIVTPDQAKARGRSSQISNADLKKELQRHVERRPNGDIIVTGIPMVLQGQKGYCVPATWSRYLQYLGIAVDEYVLANAADTHAGGGTTTRSMIAPVQSIVARHRRSLVSFNGAPSMSLIAKHIDEGRPIMWSMCSVGPFAGTGRPAGRMGTLTPEQWAKTLRSNRLDPQLVRNKDFHMCMIIGYNKATKEIATSDSWGPAHAEKWYTLEEAQRVSRDEYYVIDR